MKELYNIGQALGRDEMKKLMAGSGSCDKPDEIECADGTKKCITTCSISAETAKNICNQSSGAGITCRPNLCATC